ncbi:hypothetical protein ABFS83_14G239000 [Erythranthe nasuta]
MNTVESSCYPNMYGVVSDHQEVISSSNPNSFLYNLSILKDKVHQVQSLASIFMSPDNLPPSDSTAAVAIPTMGTLIQEIIVTASSMMFSCQQMSLIDGAADAAADGGDPAMEREEPSGAFFSDHWYVEGYSNIGSSNSFEEGNNRARELTPKREKNEGMTRGVVSPGKDNYDIIELEAADLLAKYTHYCQVCSKGFKRDANLRMHMRAHGDEYKSAAALSNPLKNSTPATAGGEPPCEISTAAPTQQRKYSCPQEGCRWNKKHAKFQPLKSMICVKNHYKRSHCPKMYVCKRCNRKNFSVLSDLRTHEKHCGDLKWQCSCGTTFSRKDKLMGHVALFVGHAPATVNSLVKMGNGGAASNSSQMQLDNSFR